ncbi:MAG TPA: hypothetical protein VN083_00770 [Vicinamibacteria bacterium]|jgi:hypothetical protein|nr:hypothetical protein [Vicinamibacteria bacterium]
MKMVLVLGMTLWAATVGSALQTHAEGTQPPNGTPCDPVTGPITFKEKDSRRLGIRNPEGRIRTFTVDSVALPHWFEEFQVGQRVTVTCKDAGIERRPIATGLKAAKDEPSPNP